MLEILRAIWAYRYFVASAIRNDYRLRFSRSKMGLAWMVIHPLVQVLIFALVLSELLSARLPGIDSKFAYAIYLMAGILCWTLFSETVSRFLTVFIDNASLIKKMAFPRVNLAVVSGGIVLLNNVLLFVSILVVFSVLGHMPGMSMLWLPILVLVTFVLAMGVGLVLGILNVFMRDIGQVVPVVLQVLFWLTPIVYSIEIVPASMRTALRWNPIYPLVASYQNVLAFNRPPLWTELGILFVGALALLLIALLLFRRASAEMADVL
ncbi:ABC transporter permease [Pseudoxanthomonas sp. 22568]|uniref:ABC transporter permease n=1 Tax=Pseudoxanthomonas sp. 22568 TaxID=3453945 RepID=UPI00296E2D2C|nr:ABC transporter permease [Pseudoxanthomonas japonensis]